MQDKPNQSLIDDAVHLSDSQEIRRAIDENWQSRRELAAALRRLNTALLTADVPTGQIRDLSASLNDEAARIEKNERLYGRMAHREHYHGKHQARHDFFYELSPLMGMSNPASMPIHAWQENGRVHATATPDWTYEGQLGHLHGGVIAALFDQLLGLAQQLTGSSGLTASLTTSYLRPTPLNKTLRLMAELKRVEGRKRFIVGELWADEVQTASCEGLFIAEKPVAAAPYADNLDGSRNT